MYVYTQERQVHVGTGREYHVQSWSPLAGLSHTARVDVYRNFAPNFPSPLGQEKTFPTPEVKLCWPIGFVRTPVARA
jgi:hypothetical protein